MAKKITGQPGLEWIAEKLSQQAMEPDEFTAQMVFEKLKADGANPSYDSVRFRISRMMKAGKLECRKAVVDGSCANVYRVKTPDQ